MALTVLGWLALATERRSVARYFAGLAGLYLVALAVAWWAMTAKPVRSLTQPLPRRANYFTGGE